jgi:hypothetical protein
MSWDVLIVNSNRELTVEEMEQEQYNSYLGNLDNIISTIKRSFPDVDFSEKEWGLLERKDFSIEFNMSSRDNEIHCFMLHVRGGESCLDAIKKLCLDNSWKAIDIGTNTFINFNGTPQTSFNEWKKVLRTSSKGSGRQR